jgi:hypothetical protein
MKIFGGVDMVAPRPPKFCTRCLQQIKPDDKVRMDMNAKGEPAPYHEKCFKEKLKEERMIIEWLDEKQEAEWGGKKGEGGEGKQNEKRNDK